MFFLIMLCKIFIMKKTTYMKKKYFDLSLSIRFPASNNKYCPTGGWLKDRIQAAENYQIL